MPAPTLAARAPLLALLALLALAAAPRGSGLVVPVPASCASGGAGAFAVGDSRNVSFGSFALDSRRPFFTLGTVTSASAAASELQFDESVYAPDAAAFPWILSAQAAIGFDPAQNIFLKGGVDDYWTSSPRAVTYLGGGRLSVAAALPVGQAVVLRHAVYSYNAFSAYQSDGIAVSDVTLFAAPGMGFYAANCSGITLDNLQIRRRGALPMSITADGVHVSNPRGGAVLIRGCVFEGQGDDGVNVPTIYQDIGAISADRRTITVGKDGQAGVNDGVLWAGATANFFRRSTLAPDAAPGTVISVSGPNVTLAAPLPAGVALFDLVNNAASYADYVEISDCVFRANRARGALVKASNALVTRNLFDHCTGSAIKTETDGCYWFEGAPVRNWTVSNNNISSCNYGTAALPGDIMLDSYVPVIGGDGVPTTQCLTPTAQPVHFGVTIANNSFFQDAGSAAAAMFSVQGVRVTGNTVVRAAGAPRAQPFDFGCGAGSCSQAVVGGNVCDGGACVVAGLPAEERGGEGGRVVQ
jgi:hypothetical protein